METMVTLAIFAVIVLVTGSLYSLAQRSYNMAGDEMELIQNARVAYDRMSREVRQSIEVVTYLQPERSESVGEIFFQNGHDTEYINYIYYYLDETDLRRARLVYYFEEEPDVYVNFNSVNEDGNPPEEEVLEDRIVAEYFENLEFWGEDGLVSISSNLEKGESDFSAQTAIFSRNY